MGERAIYSLANLTDRAKLATLKGDRAANRRVRLALYWMHAAVQDGLPLDQLLERALASYAEVPAHRALVAAQLKWNYRRARRFGCLSEPNLVRLRHGGAPIIEHPKFRGQRMEVDHILPVAGFREVCNDFANLQLATFSENRHKLARVEAREKPHAQRLYDAGLITRERLATLESLVRSAEARALGVASPTGRSSFGGGLRNAATGGGAVDARFIIPRVEVLTERMEDWERRSGAAFEAGEYVQRYATEYSGRAAMQARAAMARAREGMGRIEHLRRHVEEWRERAAHTAQEARRVQGAAGRVHAEAAAARTHWQGQLQAALAWLAHAQAEEARAERVRDDAARRLSQAEYALASARSELEAARHRTEYAGQDRQGRAQYRRIDTTPYEQAVRAAEYDVSRCEYALAEAERGLDQAVREREAAENRVQACMRALHLAEQGVAAAGKAVHTSALAIAAAERGLEEQARAAHLAGAAQEKGDAETHAAEEAQVAVLQAQSHESAAQLAHRQAAVAQADARQRSCQGRLEIAWRMDQLRAFDAPMSAF